MGNLYFEKRSKTIEQKYGRNVMEVSSGSSNRNIRNSGDRSQRGWKDENVKNGKNIALVEDGEEMPVSILKSKFQKTADEQIRGQGNNGVLKVMVKKKKKDLFADNETSAEKEKEEKIKRGILVYKSKKRMKNEEERSSPPENVTSLKGKEGKEGQAQLGGSTEKQKLREKIRGILVDAGWTIDYRPRRNRDYLDGVYINPGGTAYWSSKGLNSKAIERCTLMVRGHDNGDSLDSDGYVPYFGKRTILTWLIDSGKASLREKVQYMNRKRTRVLLEGWITRDGIHCGCCSKILTVSKFEAHAGSNLCQPFQNIFLESGPSLLQCQVDAWNSQDKCLLRDFFKVDVDGDDPDDDTCGLCGDGGDLICYYCLLNNLTAALALLRASFLQGIGTVQTVLANFVAAEMFLKKMRVLGMNLTDAASVRTNLYDHLQKILGVKHELEAEFSWSLIQRKDISDASQSGYPLRVECNSRLAVALSIMDECFVPIIDRKSGINLIHNVVYNCGSNLNCLNYRGFYTVILERGDEIISAASIRFHGDRLAEMPFIGTREIYRRQGMCRRLLSVIEKKLTSLKVGQLIIPTISEHMNTWIRDFDFQKLEDVHRKE
ncbi:Acyl-CoA N-acyltransferase with RING/FYVE/PHD-type zinc finger protein [Striga hermonthica]|uniref:Acyl-CoA N-acyltransferase with RING/FYVE/PHD-type zinc finger protein n=1 Tax=Striga hermonthica TaxID=68872 RepID=A0A9N7RID4_STRHE|nr:Acyl-CoA N-acyltransferase with RING/FYVE/PHD-type zinc finger protein [Striga hermonthica]